MDFEELKVIWDSQREEPLYAFNEAGLHAQVRQRNRAFRRSVFWRDAREISIGLCAAAGFLVFGWLLFTWDNAQWQTVLGPDGHVSRWHALMMLGASLAYLHYALYHYVGRQQQERRERGFEPSLRGDLDRMIAQTNYQIRLAQGAVRWGLIPLALGSVLAVYVMGSIVPTPPIVWLLMVIVMVTAFALDARCKRQPLRRYLYPLRDELERLRKKLVQEGARPDAAP